MTLFNDILYPADDATINLRKYMMATSIDTPKLMDLLDHILTQEHTARVTRLIRELKANCEECINSCLEAASNAEKISPDVLKMAESLYALQDDAAATAPIKKKVRIWERCYSAACRQEESSSPYESAIPDCTKSEIIYSELSNEYICEELTNHANEIDTWLKEYFDGVYDEFSDDNEFDIFVKIQVDLEFLVKILSGVCPE